MMGQEKPYFVINGDKFEAHIREFCPDCNRHFEKTVFGPTRDEEAVRAYIASVCEPPTGTAQ